MATTTDTQVERRILAERLDRTRHLTEQLAEPLAPEDQVVQSMDDVSPTKWHRAHTTWFFETFVLGPYQAGYEPVDPAYDFLFNSYYEQVGPRYPRPKRGLISRPTCDQVADYRTAVDGSLARLIAEADTQTFQTIAPLVELGINHEQQHQELLLMDCKHVLSCNPMRPAYRGFGSGSVPVMAPTLGWVDVDPGDGVVEIGHDGADFAYDNEGPRHRALLRPFRIADRLVTAGEWLAFVDDGGYRRPELWLSEGWATVQAEQWVAPLYWEQIDDRWSVYTLRGLEDLDVHAPVVHVSFFEADAYARWAGARLPSEAEWEHVAAAAGGGDQPNDLSTGLLHPTTATATRGGVRQLAGDVWEWTSSPYGPYPGFRPPPGAIGEYNGKFMCNQMVLRGGACVTPAGHTRATYRNFFPPASRWAFSGLRLATDA